MCAWAGGQKTVIFHTEEGLQDVSLAALTSGQSLVLSSFIRGKINQELMLVLFLLIEF